MLFIQRMITGALMLGFFIAIYFQALNLPNIQSMGDVGTAYLPKAVAISGMILSSIYLFTSLMGNDQSGALVSIASFGLLLVIVGMVILIKWLGLPVAAGLGAAAIVLLLERGKRLGTAIMTGIFFALLTYYGFGQLMGVPLP
ncbi:tripartite tricarboxylate transporter TctB family protein [Paenalcaligenes hominis]|mgnify:CR=1 FL=1|uniref:tripartite tricarboxylate transporter TctB family protein n=1 Tax=Paenalcaligenes hominis TaxID=643674 RepID=UPI0035245100